MYIGIIVVLAVMGMIGVILAKTDKYPNAAVIVVITIELILIVGYIDWVHRDILSKLP